MCCAIGFSPRCCIHRKKENISGKKIEKKIRSLGRREVVRVGDN